MRHVIAIPGSTRTESTHKNLIRTIAAMAEGKFTVTLFDGIGELPHFNPDLDNEAAPENVVRFRKLLKEADGILICTPEYAMGVPGTLKNAIDWCVSSAEFYRKPAALITASSVGRKGHAALMETLTIIGSVIAAETQLVIPSIKTKVSADGSITDANTAESVKNLIDAFAVIIGGMGRTELSSHSPEREQR